MILSDVAVYCTIVAIVAIVILCGFLFTKKHKRMSLVCTAIGFLSPYICLPFAILFAIIFSFMGDGYEPGIRGGCAAILLVPIVSLVGSILFVSEMNKHSKNWLLGIPLCIVFLSISIVSMPRLIYTIFLTVVSSPFSDADYILEILSVLMAPCAVLFLQSVPVNQRELVKLPTIAVAILSACTLVGYCFGMTLNSITMFIYPIIGICVLLVAIKIDQ
ncbi:MAG: hypothetical protein U9N43_07370 [Euryarchaeota archaeon]|nr:hypothetical protein [Euryarchaeota archaeon]